MSNFPVCPDGYNDEPIVLHHIGLDDHVHPTNGRLFLAACAPIWFNPQHGSTVKKFILCPGCAIVTKRKMMEVT